MFTHIDVEKIWVVCVINNKLRNIRCDIFKTINAFNMKLFIFKKR